MNYSPKKMSELLLENGFRLKKVFGQNFIIDENIINNIIKEAQLDADTLVIEIGPGAGSLTYKMSSVSGHVLCYEIDKTLENVLRSTLNGIDNITLKFEDFLKADIKNDLKNYNFDKIYIVANLPYYITTPIIMKLIEDEIDIDKIVIMVQKEVGNRFKAIPGSKDYSSLSVFLNYYFNVRKLLDVSKNVFIPKPNVDSIVIEFSKKVGLVNLKNRDLFFKLIRDSFKQKRKTLRNNLKEYDLEKIAEVLKKYNFDLSVRAEQLGIEVFIDLSNEL
ncbi:MAG: 16S rRNA (adenine(1518)-N(6)/adenine(1519)-N(6))-dimethyltransferase RsmA [Bacilli bacterium]